MQTKREKQIKALKMRQNELTTLIAQMERFPSADAERAILRKKQDIAFIDAKLCAGRK